MEVLVAKLKRTKTNRKLLAAHAFTVAVASRDWPRLCCARVLTREQGNSGGDSGVGGGAPPATLRRWGSDRRMRW